MTDRAALAEDGGRVMGDKPEGPIWVDFAPALMAGASVAQLVQIANLSLNRLTMRDIGEIFGEVGLRPELNLVPPPPLP